MTRILTLDLGTTYFKGSLFDHEGQAVAMVRRRLGPGLANSRAVARSAPSGSAGPSPGSSRSWARREADWASGGRHLCHANQQLPAAGSARSTTDADHSGPTTVPGRRRTKCRGCWRAWHCRNHGSAGDRPPVHGRQVVVAAKHLPEVWSLARRLCLISDYLTLWMTGCHSTEAGAAGLTGLLDVHRLAWWPEACERLAIPRAWLPECVRAGTDLGPIRSGIAASLGLPRLPLRRRLPRSICRGHRGGQHHRRHLGNHRHGAGHGPVCRSIRRRTGPRRVQGPGFAEGTVFQMVFGDVSANLLEAYCNTLPERPGFEELDRAAARVAQGAGGLRVDHAGGRTDAQAMFLGWTDRHGRGHAVRAILEAVAFAWAERIDKLCDGHRPAGNLLTRGRGPQPCLAAVEG